MATAAETIRLALRKLRVIGRGANPNSAQQTDALTELNAMLNALVGFGSSVAWKDIYVDADYEIVPDYPAQRLICRHSAALIITTPRGTPSRVIPDGFRFAVVDATNNAATYNITVDYNATNGWLLEGAATDLTLSTNNISRAWMFRSELGDFKRVTDLATSDSLPFPTEFDLPIALMLAHRLGGEYGQELSQADFFYMRGAKAKLRNRYCQPPIMYPGADAAAIGGATRVISTTGIDQSVA